MINWNSCPICRAPKYVKAAFEAMTNIVDNEDGEYISSLWRIICGYVKEQDNCFYECPGEW